MFWWIVGGACALGAFALIWLIVRTASPCEEALESEAYQKAIGSAPDEDPTDPPSDDR